MDINNYTYIDFVSIYKKEKLKDITELKMNGIKLLKSILPYYVHH